MSKFVIALALMLTVAGTAFGIVEFHAIYPPSVQTIFMTDTFRGDSHGEFKGDYVTILSDGSAWKIHPQDRFKYESWSSGEHVHIMYRTDFYFFSRQHKFWLYNHDRNESCRVMLAQHSTYPWKHVESTAILKKEQFVTEDVVVNGELVKMGRWVLAPYAKIVRLNDGSTWKIKNHKKFNLYEPGVQVYVGVQGTPGVEYDFIVITGLEREAQSTRAKLQY
jgi:hypothetical protein